MTALALLPHAPARAQLAIYICQAGLIELLVAAPPWLMGRRARAEAYRRRCAVVREDVLRGWAPPKLDLRV